MSTRKIVPFVSREEQNHIAYAAIALPLARMIQSGRLDPETVTREEFFDALSELGTSHENAFEIHVCRVPEEMSLVDHCVAKGEAKSGIVLLFTLLEGEVNTLIRMHLSIRGFSHNSITDALRGTDFDTKMDVLLPLLEVKVSERVRNVAHQCKIIRNLVVHNKATPNLDSLTGKKLSDGQIAADRASQFFAENPLQRIERDLQDFVDAGIAESVAVQWSRHLFEKYYERGEA